MNGRLKHHLILVGLILLAVVFMAGCGGPAAAQTGDTVRVNYTGRLADGTVFDSSSGSEPYEFTLGQGQVIPGFEQAVIGMKAGESKTVTIPVDEAYGPRRDDLIVEVGRDKLPPDINPQVGMQLQGSQGVVTIVGVSETTVTIDANHPLAGMALRLHLTVRDVREATASEIEAGSVGSSVVDVLEVLPAARGVH